jgi:hypothetical protein
MSENQTAVRPVSSPAFLSLDMPLRLGSICPCNSQPFPNANFLPLCCRLAAR